MTNVLLVGGGAREHAMALAITRSGGVLFAALPTKNPGILALAKEHFFVKDTDATSIAAWAKGKVDLAVVGPDAALAAGVTDALQNVGIAVASPTRAAAEIEWNKSFMRGLLERHHVDGRVRYQLLRSADGMRDEIARMWPLAVKPLGLTGGKGVKVSGDHLSNVNEAMVYANECLAGGAVLLEEKIEGEEFSLQAFCDGHRAQPMPAVQDHKRAFEGDEGPNTGGMGSYSGPDGLLPFVSRADYDAGVKILDQILAALRKEGRPYVGTIYGQFMLSKTGPRVIEINARFGDPEAMNVLTLLDSDYVRILQGMADGQLVSGSVKFRPEATVCKYVVPKGYGVKPMADQPLSVDEPAIHAAGAMSFYAAVNQTGGAVGSTVLATTTTSRAVGIVARGATIEEANRNADAALAHVNGPNLFHRRDVGSAALIAKRVARMKEVRGG